MKHRQLQIPRLLQASSRQLFTTLALVILFISAHQVSAQGLGILSGNQFFTEADAQEYGGYAYYSNPRSGVSYTYQNPTYTGSSEVTQDPENNKLVSGDVDSADSANLVSLGNTSGVTTVSVVFDLGVECEVHAVDIWSLLGAGTQIKKATVYVSEDGSNYTSMGAAYPSYPDADGVTKISQVAGSPVVGRYVKLDVVEQTLDYLGGWSYSLSLGEVVIVGIPLEGRLAVLSGNTFAGADDSQHYGLYENFNTPRTGVSYVYSDQVNTGGYETLNDGGNSKLSSGAVSSTDSTAMAYIGNSSGVTSFSVIYDLGTPCEVDTVDIWAFCGVGTQIKKVTYSVSTDGNSFTNIGTVHPGYPTDDAMMKLSKTASAPVVGRYVKVLVEEQTLDYRGDWSFYVALGEVVILGTALEPEPETPPLGPVCVLSGNTFQTSDDYQHYGSLPNYSEPRGGVTYTYQDPVYTGGDEITNDASNTKLSSGDVTSTAPGDMVFLGDTSGATSVAVVYDLGTPCEVETVDSWVFCGVGSQIKKITTSVSTNGVSYTNLASTIVSYPTEDAVLKVSQSAGTPLMGRYVKVVVEERSLDYLGGWSYTASLGEIVILGRAPDVAGPAFLLSDNYLRDEGTYNTSVLKINTGATYTWRTSQPFVTDSELIASDNDEKNDGAGGRSDLTDGSDIQTDAAMVSSSATGYEGQYAVVQFDLKDIYDIAEIDVWTLASSSSYMDGYEVQTSTDGSHFTSLGFTANDQARTSGGMVNAWTGGLVGRNARYVRIIMHNANDSEQLVVGEIAIWGTRPYDITLPIKTVPDPVVVNATLKSYSHLYLDWSAYNHVVNDVEKYSLYIETAPFGSVAVKEPVATYNTGSSVQRAKSALYYSLEPETTYYIAVTPYSGAGVERQDVMPIQLTTSGVIDTTGKIKNMFNINDPAYGAGQYTNHDDEWSNMLMKAELLKQLGNIQKNRWFNHDAAVMSQYSRRGIGFHLFYNDPSRLDFDNSWGVWSFSSYNEPDLAQRDVDVVTTTIQANHTALKSADTRNILLEPALGDTNTGGLSWLEDFYNADGQDGALVRTYFDVMDVHAYCKYADPYPTGLIPGVPEALVDKIDTLRTLMASHGDGNKPIVFTEIGWSTYTGGAYLKSVDEATQRNYLVRAYVISAAKGIKAIWWHNFQDNGTNPASIENNFGIIDWYGNPKPAYYGYYIMSRVLAESVFDGTLSEISNPYYGYRFRDSSQGAYITALWAADETDQTVRLSTTDAGLKVVGVDGSISYVQANSGAANVAISGAPVFIYSTEPITVTNID